MKIRKEQVAALEDGRVESELLPTVMRRVEEMGLLPERDDASIERIRKMIEDARGYGFRSEDCFVQFVSYGLQFGETWHKAPAHQAILHDASLSETEKMRRLHVKIASI